MGFSRWCHPDRRLCRFRRIPTLRWANVTTNETPHPGESTLNITSRALWAGRATIHVEVTHDAASAAAAAADGSAEAEPARARATKGNWLRTHPLGCVMSAVAAAIRAVGGMVRVHAQGHKQQDAMGSTTAIEVARTKAWDARSAKPLRETEKLQYSRNPAITAVRGWFGGVVVKIDPDGNCYGTSWVVAALLWAVQRPERILSVEINFKAAVDAGAFSALDGDCQIHVLVFMEFVGSLRAKWVGRPARDLAFGVGLSVGLVRTLLGSAAAGEGEGELGWRAIKLAIAVVSRSLDTWCAGDGWEAEELRTLATLGRAVDPMVGVDPAALSSGLAPGGLQPGGGLGLLLGLVSEYLVEETGTRKTEDYTGMFATHAKAVGDDIVDGISILYRGVVHHYDVLIETGTPLGEALSAEFGLQAQGFDPADGLRVMMKAQASQEGTDSEAILDLVGGADGVKMQQAAFEEFARRSAAER